MRVHLRTPGNAGHVQKRTRPQGRVPLTHAEQAKASEPVRGAQLLLRLQRQHGNRYVQRVLAQAREEGASASPEAEQAIRQARGGGQALDSGVRAQMEPAFGADFSGVRVHTNAQADALSRALNARSFTTGQDIFFRQGAYNPGSTSGRELLAHELTHVVQQAGGARPKLAVGQPGDKYEQEADRVAQTVMQREGQISQGGGEGNLVRWQGEEEEEREPLQTKPDNLLVVRQPETEEAEGDQELIQAKIAAVTRQEQAVPEEEESEDILQAKAAADRGPVVQRRQATTSLRRQPETPEWKKREKRFKLLLGDLKPKDPKSNMDKFKTGLDKLLLTLGHEKTAKDLTPKLGLNPKGQLLWQIVTRTGASLWLMQQGKLPNVIPDIPLSDDLVLDANLEGTFEKPRFMLYLKWRF